MTAPHMVVAGRTVEIPLRRAGYHCREHAPAGNGLPAGYFAVLAKAEGGGYLYAEVNSCHEHGCPATRHGKKSGPCNCGGDDLFRDFVEECGDSMLLPFDEAVCECSVASRIMYEAAAKAEQRRDGAS